MKTYTVGRVAADRLLKYKERQKAISLLVLKEEICEKAARDGLIIILCEFVTLLEQYAVMIRDLLAATVEARLPIADHQLTIFRVFTTTIKALELRAIQEYNLSLQIH